VQPETEDLSTVTVLSISSAHGGRRFGVERINSELFELVEAIPIGPSGSAASPANATPSHTAESSAPQCGAAGVAIDEIVRSGAGDHCRGGYGDTSPRLTRKVVQHPVFIPPACAISASLNAGSDLKRALEFCNRILNSDGTFSESKSRNPVRIGCYRMVTDRKTLDHIAFSSPHFTLKAGS
jgi:hypothetical protein